MNMNDNEILQSQSKCTYQLPKINKKQSNTLSHTYEPQEKLSFGLAFLMGVRAATAVEIPCPNCPTWSNFIQDKLKISIYLFGTIIIKVNATLYFISN